MRILQTISVMHSNGFAQKIPGIYQLFGREDENWDLVGVFEIAATKEREITLLLDGATIVGLFDVNVSLSEIESFSLIKAERGLKFSYDEFADILDETNVKISDFVIRASNCVELLIVNAKVTDDVAKTRYLEFKNRHPDNTIFSRTCNNMPSVPRQCFGEYEYKCYFVLGETTEEPICSIYMNTEDFFCDECGPT